MGKRSKFERNPRDYYPTPYEAVLPLLPYLTTSARGYVANFIEPCAGDGRLIRHLGKHGHECVYSCDIEPQADGIDKQDVLFFDFELPECDLIITNPPWERDVLHNMIEKFRNHAPTWLLFDAGWAFTAQAKPYKEYCQLIIPVGRVSWMGNGVAGMDDCAWYLFGRTKCDTILK